MFHLERYFARFFPPLAFFLQERLGTLSDRRIKDRLRLFLNRTLDGSLESKKDHKGPAYEPMLNYLQRVENLTGLSKI